jgi:hypothetical protein
LSQPAYFAARRSRVSIGLITKPTASNVGINCRHRRTRRRRGAGSGGRFLGAAISSPSIAGNATGVLKNRDIRDRTKGC